MPATDEAAPPRPAPPDRRARCDELWQLQAEIGRLIDGEPVETLRVPKMIAALKEDPKGWYEASRLDPARIPENRRRG